jgi:hypothetical protein
MRRSYEQIQIAAAMLVFGVATASAQSNLLTNGNFQDRHAIQTLQTHICNDQSSAVAWTTWIAEKTSVGCIPNSGVELETDLLFVPASGLLAQPSHIMHVRAETLDASGFGTPKGSGIVNVFGSSTNSHNRVLASALVYVVRGQVGIAIGFDGRAGLTAFTSTLGQWERITALNATQPATEFAIYGSDLSGSEFYVQNAAVCPADTDLELAACELQLGPPTGR